MNIKKKKTEPFMMIRNLKINNTKIKDNYLGRKSRSIVKKVVQQTGKVKPNNFT